MGGMREREGGREGREPSAQTRTRPPTSHPAVTPVDVFNKAPLSGTALYCQGGVLNSEGHGINKPYASGAAEHAGRILETARV